MMTVLAVAPYVVFDATAGTVPMVTVFDRVEIGLIVTRLDRAASADNALWNDADVARTHAGACAAHGASTRDVGAMFSAERTIETSRVNSSRVDLFGLSDVIQVSNSWMRLAG
jgi:hypothetical protein